MNNYDFGNYLYTLRSAKGLSQSQLAQLLGVTNKAVSKWETGSAYPSAKLMYPLAKALGVSVEELYRSMTRDGQRKSGLRRALDRVFGSKVTLYALIGVALGSWLLYLLTGGWQADRELALLTPLTMVIGGGGGFLVFYLQVRNPMCPDRFLDWAELLMLSVFGLETLMLLLTFFANMPEGFSFTISAAPASILGVALAHRRRS